MTLLANARRLSRLLRVLVSHGIADLAGPRLERWPRLARRLPSGRLTRPQRLAAILEEMGGSFIKFGQMLALQPDILSPEYCNALFNLLDRVEPFPYSEVRRIVREELGKDPEEIFESVEEKALATASVGQVHVAYLAGQKVALKAQRPKVEIEFKSDIRLMTTFKALIRGLRVGPLYWMIEPINEFVEWTREELDYRYEARYSERLRGFSEGNAIQYVPKVFAELTTRRTLVVEFLDGVTLIDYMRACERGDEVLKQRLKNGGFDAERFASHVIDNFLGDAFRHGIYHADLHPANLMILPKNTVGYIDFGITGVMSPYSRRHLVAMTLALAQGDVEGLYSQFLKLSAHGEESDLPGFRAGLERLTRDWYDHEGRHKRLRVNFTRVMTDMLHLSRRTKVMPERDIIKYIRSAIAIDGLNLRFAPDFHVGRHLEEECARFLQWEGIKEALSADTLLGFTGPGSRMLAEGPRQLGGFLDRLSHGELKLEAHLGGGGVPGAAARSRALELSGLLVALAALMVFGGQPPELGWNLFTAEILLFGLGLALLAPALRRLA